MINKKDKCIMKRLENKGKKKEKKKKKDLKN